MALSIQTVFVPARAEPVSLPSTVPCPHQPGSMSNLVLRTSIETLSPKPNSDHDAKGENIQTGTPSVPDSTTSSRTVSLELKRFSRRGSQPFSKASFKKFSRAAARGTSNNKYRLTSCFSLDTGLDHYLAAPATVPKLAMHLDWYCTRDGVLDLFQDLDLVEVENPVNKSDVTMFRAVNEQARNLPRHILKWGEAKNNDIVIWSIQESCAANNGRNLHFTVPTNRRRGMRGEVCKLMSDLTRGRGRGRELAKMFEVIKVKEEAREAVWHLVRRPEAKTPAIAQDRVENWVASVST
ncbi:hypothetical protein QQZ08_000060 [Neonectria magnoliae]|uniref:Uncharacterized protein n=1 Tax=Neonectria magnoliae TaxID=2732573 RepID=A0ABR1IJV2_9HYPO